MLVSDFNYHLPEELIAQQPQADRAGSRMLHLDRASGQWRDCNFRELPDLLRPTDLLVFNNTKVFSARLYGHRAGLRSQQVSPRNPASKEFLQGKIEVLLTKQLSPDSASASFWEWQALVRPGRKIGVGEKIHFDQSLRAEVIARGEFGERTLRFMPVDNFFAMLEKIGHIPLPPYISRADSQADRDRYQTVYARERGSVAAPTAGLHFTSEILERIRARGIETAEITLHVGLGTFQPIHADRVEDHKMHRERFSISPEAAQKINSALDSGRRIVAVGTTTVRTLEYCAAQVSQGEPLRMEPHSGEAELFIYPGFQFRVVQALLTNFHLPQSTLLMLVSAFAGRERVLAAYEHAVEQRYRFFSYGDCMLIE
ncbi:MAG TPA: tRNA preQ1(34) S-adenosylmethionine ribosyltransferase-isomerase QueA [Terriglobales bacterium]|nr:tRNA preQ1(34) S-adenosylmethionine ribosyltransferase-isomerase QueA [Terriglobales bacterium]